METSTIGRWRIEFDPKATVHCYEHAEVGSGCDCTTCRNFAALDKKAFPSELIDLFDCLGIDYRKPAEIYHTTRLKTGLHDYGGWFHFVGRIESGADAWKPVDESTTSFQSELEQLGPNFSFGFSNRLELVRECFRDRSLVQLEFHAELPWVLPEPQPS